MNWIPFEHQFLEKYYSGQHPLTRENLIEDIRILGGCSTFTIDEINWKVDLFTRGNKDFELGRLLRYRFRHICGRLN